MGRRDSPAGRRKLLADKLRAAGARFAVVSNPKHIFYLTGFSSNLNPYYVVGKGQRAISFLAVGEGGESSLLVGGTEVRTPWAHKDSGVKHEDTPSGYDGKFSLYVDYDLDVTMVPYGSEIAPEVRSWLHKSGRSEGWATARRVGIEEWHLPSIYRDVISKVFHDPKLVGISQTIMDMRKVKGSDELENIRQATRTLDYAYAFAKDEAREGHSELDMFRAMSDAAFEKYGVFGIIGGDVVASDRNLEVGGMASTKRFERGDTVIIDMQTAHNNYWCDTARTFVIGRPTKAQERALETTIEAKDMASRMLVPGTPTAEIAKAVNTFLINKGYAEMPHHVGHTVGLDDQERPWLIRGSRDVVREGQAYVIEPGIYEKATGGVRVEDCYFVTRAGREKVSRFPLGF